MNVAPAPRTRFELDPAAVRLDQAAGQGKPETRPGLALRRVADLAELLEDAGLVVRRRSRRRCPDRDADLAARPASRSTLIVPPSGVYLIAFESRL